VIPGYFFLWNYNPALNRRLTRSQGLLKIGIQLYVRPIPTYNIEIIFQDDLYTKAKDLLEGSLINCTEEHKMEGAYGSEDIHYFLDLDMTNFGLEPDEYNKQVQEIENEYSFLSKTSFRCLRNRVSR